MKKFAPLLALLLLAACDQQQANQMAQMNAMRLTDQGYDLLQKNQAQASLAMFDQAIAGDNKNIRAYQGKGIALNQLGRHAEAEGTYQKALDIHPDALGVANNLAMSRIMRGKYEEAETLLTPLAKKYPSNATVTENLALANCMLGKRDEARQLYGKSLKPAEIEENIRFCNKFEMIRKKK